MLNKKWHLQKNRRQNERIQLTFKKQTHTAGNKRVNVHRFEATSFVEKKAWSY